MNDRDYVEPISVTASSLVIYGLTLSEWVAMFTLIYLTIHIVLLIPRLIDIFKRKKKDGQ